MANGGSVIRQYLNDEKYYTGEGTSKKVSSVDKKLSKRFPDRTWVKIDVRIPKSGQISPQFEFKRKKPAA